MKLIKLLVGNIFLNSEPEVSVNFYLSITEVRLVQNFTMLHKMVANILMQFMMQPLSSYTNGQTN
jgi:hypothetical protein